MSQTDLSRVKRLVIKLGTGILTRGVGGLDPSRMEAVAAEVARLRARGIEVVLVSSGAVGLGMGLLGLSRRPSDLPTLQACAALGQALLINTWQAAFREHAIQVAQILLTREDLRARSRHNAVVRTMERLLACGAVPVVNENDTVSAAEIRFGDNDTLSALVASVSGAGLLYILSTIEGLLNTAGEGELIPQIDAITPEIEALATGTTSATSVGGMVSKLSAAKIAMRAGCAVVIANGRDPAIVGRILDGSGEGTFFAPAVDPIRSKRRWLAIQDKTAGTLTVDAGACEALLHGGKSLLPGGISEIRGTFDTGDVVQVADSGGHVIARGIAEHDSATLQLLRSADNTIAAKTNNNPCAIHRDNLVLL